MLADESTSIREVADAIAGTAVDGIRIGIKPAGGLHPAMRANAADSVLDIPGLVGSRTVGEIGSAANVQLTAEIGSIRNPCDLTGPDTGEHGL